jgi:hypothetical protein
MILLTSAECGEFGNCQLMKANSSFQQFQSQSASASVLDLSVLPGQHSEQPVATPFARALGSRLLGQQQICLNKKWSHC